MRIFLTFDVEIWCDGWNDLDNHFASCFERYVFGRSTKGDFALPKTLEILGRHGLSGVFFVEPLFAARFGVKHLATIVDMIRSRGHDVQLHLHPEWTDEIRPLLFPGAAEKRPLLSYYTFEEQTILISLGRDLLGQAGCRSICAFRAGSFGANRDTYRSLHGLGIGIDSSMHAVLPISGPDLRATFDICHPFEIEHVQVFPLTMFEDGLRRLRPAQVGSCSFAEMREAIESAAVNGCEHFVILSHNFEMLKPGRNKPDPIVVARFEQLCSFLARQRDRYEVATFSSPRGPVRNAVRQPLARTGFTPTLRRYAEQAVRRLY